MSRQRAASTNLRTLQLRLLGVGVVALVASRLAAGVELADFYRGWLIGFLPCWVATVGCLGMLMLHHLMGGNWGRAARPALEAGAATVPFVALGFLPIALHLGEIFPWAAAAASDDPLLAKKLVYLNDQAFWTRAAIYFGLWAVSSAIFVPMKPSSNSDGEKQNLKPQTGAIGLILLVVSVSFAAIDWGMSLEPHWFSAIYGAQFVAGGAVVALAVAILAVAVLRLGNPVHGVGHKQLRSDLGSLLLAMLMIWMYFSFSQFLIIWSANLPEENVWYLARGRGGWQLLAVLVVLLHFVVPFALLMSQDVRRDPRTLAGVAGLILVAHTAYLLWTIAPAFYASIADIPWTAYATLLGIFSLWGASWLTLLGRRQTRIATRDFE